MLLARLLTSARHCLLRACTHFRHAPSTLWIKGHQPLRFFLPKTISQKCYTRPAHTPALSSVRSKGLVVIVLPISLPLS